MKSILLYLAQVIIASGILYGYYHLVLRNRKFHQYNRFYLLGIIFISILVPFLQIPIYFNSNDSVPPVVLKTWQTISYTPEIEAAASATLQEVSPQSYFTWENFAYAVYILIAVIVFIRLIYSINRIIKLKRRNPVKKVNGIQLVDTTDDSAPFSFFRWMFWHRRIEIDSHDGQQIFRHEVFHIQQKHSIDIVFIEIVRMVFWINPFFHIIQKELRTIHEFLADKFATTEDTKWEYSELLLMQVLNTRYHLVNPFFHNQIKRRIAMITKPQKTSQQYLRKLLVLPLSVIVIALFAFKIHERKNITSIRLSEPIVVVIDPGHGGNDLGVKSPDNKFNEASISLQLAQTIKDLASEYNIQVVLTRENANWSDGIKTKEESFKNALELTKTNKADAFISLHINADDKPRQFQQTRSGFEAFISAKRNDNKGKQLATSILQNLSTIYTTDKLIRERKDAGIYVLDRNEAPSLLLQCGYINNRADLDFILNKDNQQKIARQILEGLKDFKQASVAFDQDYKLTPDTSKSFLRNNWGIEISASEILIDKPGYNLSNKDIVPDLVILNGEELTGKEFKDRMKYIRMIKAKRLKTIPAGNENAIQAYGERARNGVFEISGATFQVEGNVANQYATVEDSKNQQPLVILDGKMLTGGVNDIKSLDPNTIESINILKDSNAVKKYGEKARHGVIEINLKQNIVLDLKTETNSDVKNVMLADIKSDNLSIYDLEEKQQDNSQIVFEKMEIEPAFPGGASAWSGYLKRNLNNSIPAQNGAKEGVYSVFIQFIVHTDGQISDIKPLTNHGFGMEKEAMRVIKASPKWLPGIQNGHNVNGRRKQVINFTVADRNTTAIVLPEVVLVAYTDTKLKAVQLNDHAFATFNPAAAGSKEWRKYIERNINSNIAVAEGRKAGDYRIPIQFERNKDGSISHVKALNYSDSKIARHCIALIRQLPNVLPSSEESDGSGLYIQPLLFTIIEETQKAIAFKQP